MWKCPWTYREALAIGAGLVVVGLLLQLMVGGINWSLFAYPVNIMVLLLTLGLTLAFVLLGRHSYAVKYITGGKSAVVALTMVSILTVIMGFGYDLLSFWPFVLAYFWMTIIVGAVAMRQIFHIRRMKGRWGSMLSHLGLYIALLCGTLGNADMQKLRMAVQKDGMEWRALDADGRVRELDFAVRLHNFTIDMYPAKLVIVDKATGESIPSDNPDVMLLDEGIAAGTIAGWAISIDESYERAARVGGGDSLKYVAWPSMGGCCAVKVTARNGGMVRSGWVSCGSFMFPYQSLMLTPTLSLVMPEREPRRYASDVTFFTSEGEKWRDTIEVNKPASVMGWKVYQLSYDEAMGEWSTVSVLELVRDPWLPYVYTGIFMMLLGAVLVFFKH